ncbi:hypothetical protein [Dokdonella sp.]|uniref:hypothetical protein n=1 Tax=Dokdonella sp. TaxID=2291710 RepID=UPI001B159457|nr:hypothetical protein [Dokdonella sp.]MBO9661741.1 hypothetical protein [Dokdonella sp.]
MRAQPTRPWSLAVLLLLLLLAARLHAGESEVSPQWTTSLWREGLAYDRIAHSLSSTTLAVAGGERIAVTAGASSDVVLRRYAADGSVLLARTQAAGDDQSQSDVVLRPDPDETGFYLLAGAHQDDAVAMRFDNALQLQWSVPIPHSGICNSDCVRMEALPDGSIVVLRPPLLARIGRDGVVQWTADVVEDAGGFWGGALALGANDDLWVAVSTTQATLARFDLDGTRLGSDTSSCSNCGGIRLTDLDVLPDGSAVLVGGTGRSLFARYDAGGKRLLWIAGSAISSSYQHVAHDADGAVYALAETWSAPAEVHRIDPASGSVLWRIPADRFVVRDSGVLALRWTDADLLADAVTATGLTVWSRSLGGVHAEASQPRQAGGETELLVGDRSLEPDNPCAVYPRVVRLHDDGGIVRYPLPCRSVQGPAWLYSLDAVEGVGIVASLGAQLEARSPEGDLRWRVDACTWCDTGWIAAALTTEGDAWGVRQDGGSTTHPDRTVSIQHIDANGQIDLSVPAATGGWSYPEIRLFATPARVVVLTVARGALAWQSVERADGASSVQIHPMLDDTFHVLSARMHDDGSVTLVARGLIICDVGCSPFNLSVLRIANDGTLAWRHDFPNAYWPAAPTPDGGAVLVSQNPDANAPPLWRRIDPQGIAISPIPLTGVTPVWTVPTDLYGPVDGHWLLNTRDFEEGALWSLTDDGEVRASRPGGYGPPHAFGSGSYLLSATTPDGARLQLLDAITLETRALLPFGASDTPPFDNFPWRWRVLADGSVYGTWQSRGRTGLARYILPWGVLPDRLFGNGFD